jgi:Fic family protein
MAARPHMYSEISQFEPLMPAESGELEDIAFELTKRSATLAGQLPPETLAGVRELLRIVNSYYSNLIEGHNTHPIDVERAMRADYSNNEDKRALQKESLIHIDLQRKIAEWLENDPELDVAAPDFLRRIHREFYEQMPEKLRWVKGDNMELEWVEAGEFRNRQVAVGAHLPPVADSLNAFLDRFDEFYKPGKMHGLKPIVALAAAHHRLMWIHPFLDGNGRVARLFTDAYFCRTGLSGYGLWNVSRGLARRSAEYKKFLAAADFPREGDLDGRGNLSNRTLTEFCRFFLEVCHDQAEFMNSLLSLADFLGRLEKYVSMRENGLVVDEKGITAEPLHARAGLVLREAAISGEIARGKVFEIIEMSERSGRNILKSLMDEGLLVPSRDSHKSTVRLGFPAHAAGYWFPKLFPLTAGG